ncbi:FecR domain-containing protein [Chitinophagaceae bacterium LB-8]|uniref:FecR domain-containing protein n=1 Tax=Paraflavisolibacter caeni TaxID=2982496 RepID=A0A9X2XX43_9BACT|nr:FecR family protein [Paraflavisolibacter caeni]MCU7550680.1 FecR domain-containing protein [Paraflavisolibacter caeni]
MTEQYIEELIQKYADGTATEEEILKLMKWYHAAPIGDVLWHTTDPGEQQHVYNRMLRRLKKAISPGRAKVLNLSWAKVAAILVVFIGAAMMVLRFTNSFSSSYITVTNPPGKIKMVRLPDSSSVWLNASSTLSYVPSFKNKRALKLDGEAYFEVTHDPEHPFKVDAGGVQTTVLGTSFNIKAYAASNTTDISVVTGKVKVTNKAKDLAVLTPSMLLEYNRKDQTVHTRTINTNSVISWQKGILQFEGQTLAEIASTLERWYGVTIIFASPGMRNCRYYMGLENTISLDKLLATMSELTEMQYAFSSDRKTITLSGKECQ